MPNPLTMAISAPNTTEKPAAPARGPVQKTGSESFEDILGQEGASPNAPDVEVTDIITESINATSEVEIEVEIEVEVEVMPITTSGAPATTEPAAAARQLGHSQNSAEIAELPNIDQEIPAQSQPTTEKLAAFATMEQLESPAQTGLVQRSDSTLPGSPHPLDKHVPGVAPQPVQLAQVSENGRVLDQLVEPKSVATGPDAILALNTEKVPPQQVVASTPETPTPGLAPSVAQLQLMANATETEPAALNQEVEVVHASKEEPLPQTTREPVSQLSGPSSAARAEIARAIAGQLAATIQTRPGSGAMEIALNPEELGRVSIVLNGRDDGLHMSIATERPETLDLMRRHLSVLAEEFQKLGYGDLSLDLGTSWNSGAQEQGADGTEPHAALHSDPVQSEQIAQPTPNSQMLAAGAGIDMRI